jgi:WD40 repeat protein
MRRSTLQVILLALTTSSLFAASGPFNGKVAFVSDRDGNSEIYTMKPDGTSALRLTNNVFIDTHPSWSPDGKKIAFASDRDGNFEIYVMAANGTNQTRLTNNAFTDSQPTWSPDGQTIVFQSTRTGNFDIFRMDADGTDVIQLTNDPGFDLDPAFSRKGDKIVFVSSRDGNFEVYSMDQNGVVETRLTNNTVFEARPDFSPNGTRIVFERMVPEDTGLSKQVAVMNSDGTNDTVLTSAGANGNPAFSADGRRIVFDSSRDLNSEVYVMKLDGASQTRLTNNDDSDTQASSQRIVEVETVGVYRPSTGQWILDTSDVHGINFVITFGGQPGDLPVAGDWNGDNLTDIGVFRNGTFNLALLKKGTALVPLVVEPLPAFNFGQAGDVPVSGDWDNDGIDDVGVFRDTAPGRFVLRQPKKLFLPFPSTIIITIAFDFGQPGDLPVAGDWDGDGIDTVGVLRPADNATFLLTNQFANVTSNVFDFGSFGDRPLAGDWLASGSDDIGIFHDTTSTMLLATELISKPGLFLTFGQVGDIPVAGNWTP